MKFIITADDYGISPIIDQAIEHAAEQGLINSVAAFANIPARESGQEITFDVSRVAAFKKRFPHVSVGLHLSLTSGYRVAEHTTSLCRRKGRDRRFKGVLNQLGNVDDTHVYDEIKAQIKLFEDAGISIEHFSDHHGILNHTEIGKKALYAAVQEYNASVNQSISIRNPVLMSSLVRDKENFLDTSNATRRAALPLLLRGIARFFTKPVSEFREMRYRMGYKAQKRLLDEMSDLGIPSTDFFVDTLWNAHGEEAPREIFNVRNYGVDPQIQHPLSADEQTVEIMVHIAASKKEFDGDYGHEIRRLKKRKGVDTRYVKKGRLDEAHLLHTYLNKYCKPQDRVSFSTFLKPLLASTPSRQAA